MLNTIIEAWLAVAFIYLFFLSGGGAVDWEYFCPAITLLHRAPPNMASVLVLFVIVRGFNTIDLYKGSR